MSEGCVVMQRFRLPLFRVKLECRKCRHIWRALCPRVGDRYHVYMKRGDLYLFMLDDEISLGLQAEQSVVESILKEAGFHCIEERCPACNAPPTAVRRVRGLLTAHLLPSSEDVEAIELAADDFERKPVGWDLKGDVRAALEP